MPSSTTSEKPFSSSPASRRQNTGSLSKRGKHHHTRRAVGIDERRGAAVADDGKIEPVIGHDRSRVLSLMRHELSSQRRTSRRALEAVVTPGDLAADRDRDAVEFRHDGEHASIGDVVTDERPAGGRETADRSSVRARAVPLLNPVCLISTTALPGSSSIELAGSSRRLSAASSARAAPCPAPDGSAARASSPCPRQ